MNKLINQLWDELYSHPLFSEGVAHKIRTEVKAGVGFGADRFTLTRSLLTRTRDFLDMMMRIENREGSEK